MGRKVIKTLILCLVLAVPLTALAELPSRAGLAAAVKGDWYVALERIASGEDASRANRYFRAVALMESGQADEAYLVFSKLSRSKGSFAGAALERIAEYAFDMGRFEEIVAAVGESPGKKYIEPDAFYYRLGQSYFMLDKHKESKKFLQKVSSGKWRSYARHTLSLIEYADGNPQAAIERIGEALESAQAHPDRGVRKALVDLFRLIRGRIIHQAALGANELSQKKKNKLYKVAISQLSLIKKSSPLFASALRTLGWCAAEMSDSTRALASFELAIDADIDNQHEDLWAMGRVFERLGFFEEAADHYAEASVAATEQAELIRREAQGGLELPRGFWARGWGTVASRLEKVETDAVDLAEVVFMAQNAAYLRAMRLDGVDEDLEKVSRRIGMLTEELVLMDADLYHYLDVIPARALFPKKDRPRIDALLNKQDRLLGNIAKTEQAVLTLQDSRSWEKAPEALLEKVAQLWQRLSDAGREVAKSQLRFLEGLKHRVSVREKELMRLVESRKTENAALGEPLKQNRDILQGERDNLGVLEGKLAVLVERADKLAVKISKLRQTAHDVMTVDYRNTLFAKADALKLKADTFVLDEAQALHLFEKSLAE